MSTLDEITKEKQRLNEALARLDAQRERLSSQLSELDATERVLARYSKGSRPTNTASKQAPPVATNAAASSASRRSPRSFQPATSRRTASSYATAARALAKPSRRPEHSRQRCTGHAVGAPQRSHSGGRMSGSPLRQAAHSSVPPQPHTRQRRGSSRSSTPPTLAAQV